MNHNRIGIVGWKDKSADLALALEMIAEWSKAHKEVSFCALESLKGVSPKNIEIFIRNYENDAIDDDTFLKILKIFNLDPSYFGYNFEISDEDYNDLEDVLEKTDS